MEIKENLKVFQIFEERNIKLKILSISSMTSNYVAISTSDWLNVEICCGQVQFDAVSKNLIELSKLDTIFVS